MTGATNKGNTMGNPTIQFVKSYQSYSIYYNGKFYSSAKLKEAKFKFFQDTKLDKKTTKFDELPAVYSHDERAGEIY